MFEDDHGKHVSASYDLLIAADGVHSQIRQGLQQFDATLDVRAYESTRGYKSLRNLGVLNDKGVTFDIMHLGILVSVYVGRSIHENGEARLACVSSAKEHTLHNATV